MNENYQTSEGQRKGAGYGYKNHDCPLCRYNVRTRSLVFLYWYLCIFDYIRQYEE